MNTEKNGKAPVDKNKNPIVAHHYKQQAGGPIVLMPTKHHDKKHRDNSKFLELDDSLNLFYLNYLRY